MHSTLRVCASASRVHRPLIQFIGKRVWSSKPDVPHVHPAAPAEYKKSFSEFLSKFQSSSPSSAGRVVPSEKQPSTYTEFWDAPSRIWNPLTRRLSDAEIEAIDTGGASLR